MRIAVLRAAREGDEGRWPYVFPNGHRTETAEFIHNPTHGSFDGIVVVQSVRSLSQTFNLTCPPTRTLCALIEPPDIITLPDEFTQQFFTVIGPDRRVACRNSLQSAAGHHWFVELTADQACATPITNKPKLISAVVSAKTDTPGHRSRLNLMRQLKDHFGDDLDWYGQGVRAIGSKLSAIADHKYHIVLENGRWPHYWTEKILDSYMANAFPFYWGAPNVADYFGRNSYSSIDPCDPQAAIRTIENAIKSNVWERRQEELATARKRVGSEYHPYSIWSSALAAAPASEPQLLGIKPFSECRFGFRQRVNFRIRNFVTRAVAMPLGLAPPSAAGSR